MGPRAASLLVLAILPAIPARAETPDEALEYLVSRVRASPPDVSGALSLYNRIESNGFFDLPGRHRIHRGLVKALGETADPALAKAAEAYFSPPLGSFLPPRIVLLKALLSEKFPAPRERRVEWLVRSAREKPPLALWGAHLLGDSRWPEAVEALIGLLGEEEAKDPEGLLAHLASSELYRLLGANGLGTAEGVRKGWEAMKKTVPDHADHGFPGARSLTATFFGDRISPRAVFAIDISTSMTQETKVGGAWPGSTVPAGPKGEAPRMPKVEIVKAELARGLSALRSSSRFTVIAYNADIAPWRRSLRLHAASPGSVRAAGEWIRKLPVAPGTNILAALTAALSVPEVETIYLLSDGAPSRGGGPREIEAALSDSNYLTGIRIVTYGFAAEPGGGSFDEDFMRRLAAGGWGWYRRLN